MAVTTRSQTSRAASRLTAAQIEEYKKRGKQIVLQLSLASDPITNTATSDCHPSCPCKRLRKGQVKPTVLVHMHNNQRRVWPARKVSLDTRIRLLKIRLLWYRMEKIMKKYENAVEPTKETVQFVAEYRERLRLAEQDLQRRYGPKIRV